MRGSDLGHAGLFSQACRALFAHLPAACKVRYGAVPDFGHIGELVLVHRLHQPVDQLHAAEALAVHLALVPPLVRLQRRTVTVTVTVTRNVQVDTYHRSMRSLPQPFDTTVRMCSIHEPTCSDERRRLSSLAAYTCAPHKSAQVSSSAQARGLFCDSDTAYLKLI